MREVGSARVGLVFAVATLTTAGLAVAGCGSSGSSAGRPAPVLTSAPAATPTTVSTARIAQEYLAAVNSANAAGDAFHQQVVALGSNATVSQFAGPAKTLVAAYGVFDSVVLRLGTTGQTSTDIRSVVTADGALEGDLSALGSQSVQSVAQWNTTFLDDGGRVAAASNVVRGDLGLP